MLTIREREINKSFKKYFQTFQLGIFENTNHICISAGARLVMVRQMIKILSSWSLRVKALGIFENINRIGKVQVLG